MKVNLGNVELSCLYKSRMSENFKKFVGSGNKKFTNIAKNSEIHAYVISSANVWIICIMRN